jgi:hypothetical protein
MHDRVPVFEIWTDDSAGEFAAKVSGQPRFILKTKLDVEYTRLIYAAPFVEKNLDGLAVILDRIVKEIER